MGDRDDGPPVGAEVVLQPADGAGVEVVGRFVEEQQFGRGGQDAGEGEPGPLAAGERGERAVAGEVGQAESVQGRFGAGVCPVAVAVLVGGEEVSVRGEFRFGGTRVAGIALRELPLRLADAVFEIAEVGEGRVDRVPHGAGGAEVECLGEVAGAAGEPDGDLTGVRRLGPGQQAEQRGLSGAVLSDDGDLLAGADGEGHLVEHGAVSVRLGDVLHGQLGAVALRVHGCLLAG